MNRITRLEQSVRELQELCKKMVDTIVIQNESKINISDEFIIPTKEIKPIKKVDKYKARPKDLNMVIDYFKIKKVPDADKNANKFYNHYSASGWMRGKTKIKNWKMCLSSWDFEISTKADKSLWTRNTNGFVVGYCEKCGDSGMGNSIYDLKSSASCCGVQYVATKPNKKVI